MALFGDKKTKKKEPAKREVRVVKDVRGKLAQALVAPWLSEKALIATEKGIYTFQVSPEATKEDISLAVQKLYKVAPRQIRIVNLPAKKVNLRTRRGFGTKSIRRKAYVYLAKGETIQFA
ncbi:MAG: 50S ribosomal protein L23 [Minisyncoccia bacterium]